MELTEKTAKEKQIFNGKIIKVSVDDIILPNGKKAKREVVSHNGGCCIVPLTSDNEILLVEQFRYPYKEIVWEIPAGKKEQGEDPRNCAIRELREETGAFSEEIIDLGIIYPSPGYTDEKIYLYLAKNIEIGEMSLDEDEFVNVKAFKLEKLLEMIENNEIKDSKTIIGILRTSRLLTF